MSTIVLMWLLPVLLAVALLLLATRHAPFLKPRTYAEAAAGLFVASFPFIIAAPFTIYTKVFLAVLQLWAILLALRLIFGRLDKAFAYPSTQGNSIALFVMMLSVAGLWWLGNYSPGILGDYQWRWVAFLCAVLVTHMIFLAQLLWTFKHYKLHVDPPHRKLGELPTVSVCIPARNETHALEDCLMSVLASSYPKLEVLVLDDCSQDKTSDVIRSFAHDGVRFIQGEVPADGWLGRNQALQTLAEQATGDYILFMDVDTRLSVTSIAQLMDYTLDNNMNMLAVLPQNRLGLQPGAMFGTLYDFWQMVLPITRRRISVANQAWLIKAETLQNLGGFKSVAHKIVPEMSFARRLFGGDQYRFIAGNEALGITTAKRWTSELESAIRVLYPTYKRQPLYALVAIIAILATIMAPLVLVVGLLVTGQFNGVLALAVAICAFSFGNYALVLRRTHPRLWLLATLLLPVVAVQEVFLILASMLQYEFGEVNWKGRNVCYPVISSVQSQQVPPALRPRP